MTRVNATRLRRALGRRGFTPATWIPEASAGRGEEATVRPARLVEGERLATRPVGPPEACPDPVGFLDGIQRYEVVGYLAAAPLILARVAAAVRERPGPTGRPRLVAIGERTLAIGRGELLAEAADLLAGTECQPLPADVAGHPVREIQAARGIVDRTRGALELEVGRRFRERSGAWLVVDGALSEGISWAADPRMIGVVKSHSTLPFEGADQTTYLTLPQGHRTTVFAPETRSLAPVYSWALRLWPWEGRDLFHGLVRIETEATAEAIAGADRVARWLLAERAPISTPDARWDRLLYGIHEVEGYLRARQGTGGRTSSARAARPAGAAR